MEEAYQNWVRLSQTSWWEWGPRNWHHLFPKVMKDKFWDYARIDVDQYLVKVPKWMNQWLHREGYNIRGGWWNRQWKDFFKVWEQWQKDTGTELTKDQWRRLAEKYMEDLRKIAGIDDVPWGPMPRTKPPWWRFWVQ